MRAEAKRLGVRCIGLADMMRELKMERAVKVDCENYAARFPDGEPATYKGQPVLVRRMGFDGGSFPFYRVVFELDGETWMAGGSEIGSTFRW